MYGAPADAPMVLAFDTATLAVDATRSVDTESVPAGREERRGSADTAGRLSQMQSTASPFFTLYIVINSAR